MKKINQCFINTRNGCVYTIKGAWSGRKPGNNVVFLMRVGNVGHAFAGRVTYVKSVHEISDNEFIEMTGGHPDWFVECPPTEMVSYENLQVNFSTLFLFCEKLYINLISGEKAVLHNHVETELGDVLVKIIGKNIDDVYARYKKDNEGKGDEEEERDDIFPSGVLQPDLVTPEALSNIHKKILEGQKNRKPKVNIKPAVKKPNPINMNEDLFSAVNEQLDLLEKRIRRLETYNKPLGG